MVIPQITGPDTSNTRPISSPKAPRAFQTQLVEAAKQLPANAEFYFAGAAAWLRPKLGSVLATGEKGLPDRVRQWIAALRTLKTTLGTSFAAANWGAGFLSLSRRSVGLVIRAPWPSGLRLQGQPAKPIRGLTPITLRGGLQLIQYGRYLLAGNEAGLRELLAVAAGQLPTWAADQTSRLFQLAHKSAASARVIVALDLRRVTLPAGMSANYLLFSSGAGDRISVNLHATPRQTSALLEHARSHLRTLHSNLNAVNRTGIADLLGALAAKPGPGAQRLSLVPSLTPVLTLVLATIAAERLPRLIGVPR